MGAPANAHLTDTVVMGMEPGGWYFCEKDGYIRWRWFAMNGFVLLAEGSTLSRKSAVRRARRAVTRLGRPVDLPVGL